MRGVEVAALFLILPREVAPPPDIGPTVLAGKARGAFLERVVLAGRIAVWGWLVQQVAKVDEMLLARRAFGAGVRLPFGDELSRGHAARMPVAVRFRQRPGAPLAAGLLPRSRLLRQFDLIQLDRLCLQHVIQIRAHHPLRPGLAQRRHDLWLRLPPGSYRAPAANQHRLPCPHSVVPASSSSRSRRNRRSAEPPAPATPAPSCGFPRL